MLSLGLKGALAGNSISRSVSGPPTGGVPISVAHAHTRLQHHHVPGTHSRSDSLQEEDLFDEPLHEARSQEVCVEEEEESDGDESGPDMENELNSDEHEEQLSCPASADATLPRSSAQKMPQRISDISYGPASGQRGEGPEVPKEQNAAPCDLWSASMDSSVQQYTGNIATAGMIASSLPSSRGVSFAFKGGDPNGVCSPRLISAVLADASSPSGATHLHHQISSPIAASLSSAPSPIFTATPSPGRHTHTHLNNSSGNHSHGSASLSSMLALGPSPLMLHNSHGSASLSGDYTGSSAMHRHRTDTLPISITATPHPSPWEPTSLGRSHHTPPTSSRAAASVTVASLGEAAQPAKPSAAGGGGTGTAIPSLASDQAGTAEGRDTIETADSFADFDGPVDVGGCGEYAAEFKIGGRSGGLSEGGVQHAATYALGAGSFMQGHVKRKAGTFVPPHEMIAMSQADPVHLISSSSRSQRNTTESRLRAAMFEQTGCTSFLYSSNSSALFSSAIPKADLKASTFV